MDLSSLSTQDNAEAGVWKELSLPYAKKTGVEIKILGADSDAVQKYNREQLKKIRLTARDGDKIDDEALDAIVDSSDEGVLVRIGGIRSKAPDDPVIILFDRTLGNNKESYQFLIEKIPAAKDFILKISGDRTNFLSVQKKNLN
jgi:hypothetical protein